MGCPELYLYTTAEINNDIIHDLLKLPSKRDESAKSARFITPGTKYFTLRTEHAHSQKNS